MVVRGKIVWRRLFRFGLVCSLPPVPCLPPSLPPFPRGFELVFGEDFLLRFFWRGGGARTFEVGFG